MKKLKIYSSSKDNIWGADLADMQLISKYNKCFQFYICIVDIYSKYSWLVPLKDKEDITITNAFPKVLNESGDKPNKIRMDKGSEFCHRLMIS